MGSYGQFGAVNTKIRILKRQFLKDEDYKQLTEARTLEEAVAYLRDHTGYGAVMTDSDDGPVEIARLETLFRVQILKKYEKLVHYLADDYRELFRIIFMRYEVENLKLIFRALNRREDLAPLVEGFYRSEVYPQLDYERLVMAKTIEEVVHLLQRTPYHRILIPYIGEAPDRILFYLEMNLDRLYFNRLAQALENLPKDERTLVAELLGKNTDILNIQWIYRGLKFYRISSEELFNYCLTSGYALKLEELRQLCYAHDENDLVTRLRRTGYRFLFQENSNIDRFMELGMERYLFTALREMERKGPMTVLPAIVYIHRIEYEMRDLFSLLEAKKFGMGPEETAMFLVRAVKT